MLRQFVIERPLQAGKLAGTSLTVFLGIGGFFRIVSADAVIDDPILADGQFLALVLIALICIVFLESPVTGYRVLRDDQFIRDQLTA